MDPRSRREGSPRTGALPPRAVIRRLRREMAAAADPSRAKGMQTYMKSTMPYYGINLPAVRVITRQVLGDAEMGCEELRETVLQLWRGARRREERYAAMYLLTRKSQRSCVTPALMPVFEEMVAT